MHNVTMAQEEATGKMAVKDICLATISKKTVLALGFTEEDAKLLHLYRNRIPCLNKDNPRAKGFIVNGRDLHRELKVPTRYTQWIARRIPALGFMEGEDFIPFLGESTGGRPTAEYFFTLGAARQLSMVEKTEVGNIARRFFNLIFEILAEWQTWHKERVEASEGAKAISTYLFTKYEDDKHLAIKEVKVIQTLISEVIKQKYKEVALTSKRTVERTSASEEVNLEIAQMENAVLQLLEFGMGCETIVPLFKARFLK